MSPSSRLQARERELGRPLVPAARRRAAELGVDLATVAGTGRNGVVRVADVEAAAGAVDSREHATSGSATLPHRGTAPGPSRWPPTMASRSIGACA
jgi:pyruvate/2-oxoglutarate dehydrogenase complex dihydrolipoamide acyltransferase (E2) component